MVAKGNKDSHNYDYGYVKGVRVQETEKWGRSAAVRRYGSLDQPNMKPKDEHGPQDPGSKYGPGYNNDTSGWRYDGQGKKPRG
jgi:hypothetical protein